MEEAEQWGQGGLSLCLTHTHTPLRFAHPQVYTDSQQEQVEEEMEAREQQPLVFHHHYLPCPGTSLGPMALWPASFLPVPPHQPPWQGAPGIRRQPPASRRGEV